METLMFAFGVLTMVLVALAAVAVYSTVKVLKLKKSLEIQDRLLNESITNLYRSNGQIEDSLHRRFDDESRDVRERINQIHYEISHRDESLSRRIDELNSYVDRRFDKLLSDPKFCLNKEDKKLIKG
jgi:hypothetical protein